jgi:hypothetical protein
MHLMFVRPRFLCLGIALGLSACGPETQGADTVPAAAERRRMAAMPVEWGMSDSSAQFTDITAVAVDRSGHVYVADFYRQQVTVLSQRGQFDRVIGRRGSGPGEFRAIRSIQVTDGDSLLVYDPSLARISMYAPNATAPAYVVDLAAQLRGAAPFFLWKLPRRSRYLALFRPPFVFVEGKTDLKRTDAVRILESDGAQGAEILSFPSRSFLVSGTSLTPNPFGREGIVQLTVDGNIAYLWTDSATVTTYSPEGRRHAVLRVPHHAPRISGGDVEREAAQLKQWGLPAAFQRVVADSAPGRWPAATDLITDDQGNIFVGLSGGADTPVEWAGFRDGRYVLSVFLPPREKLHAVRLPFLFVERRDELDVPRIVVYRVEGRGPGSGT